MSTPSPSAPGSDSAAPGWRIWLAGAVIAAAAWVAYLPSRSAPFIFDDVLGVERNVTIHQLWPLTSVLQPPGDSTLSGRPVSNLSFALSYAMGGGQVEYYHAGNVVIHLLAGLVLFGIVRRTLSRLGIGDPLLLGFLAALLWTLHPLQTEAVSYVVQRVESLMGLFYLLTLYCFIRGWDGSRRSWYGLGVLACLAGAASKEVIVSAPVMVFLYDWALVSGRAGRAWIRRWPWYVALLAPWGLLGWLVYGTHGRNGTSGFALGLSPWKYYATQFPAILRYLRLAVWPRGLVFDYGLSWVSWPSSVIPAAVVVLLLAAGSAYAFLRPAEPGDRRRALGYAGLWFFAILAPTSLVPGNRQNLAEHRMYLALAPLAVLAVVGLQWGVAAAFRRPGPDAARRRSGVILGVGLLAALALGWATARRNRIYLTNQGLWADTVAKNPGNAYARLNLANDYVDAGRIDDAIVQFREAVRLKPDYPEGHNNLGTALVRQGRAAEGVAELREAARLKPAYDPDVHDNIAVALMGLDLRAAIAEFEEVLRHQPDNPDAHYNLGNALGRAGRTAEAAAHYRAALRLHLDLPQVHNNLGNALRALGQFEAAEAEYAAAVREKPDYAEAYANLGNALSGAGRPAEAIPELETALRLQPNFAEAHFSLGNAFVRMGQAGDAAAEYETTLRLNPRHAFAHNNLGKILFGQGRLADATREFGIALRLRPNDAEEPYNLGLVFFREGQLALAERYLENAARLQPGFAAAQTALAQVRAAQARAAVR